MALWLSSSAAVCCSMLRSASAAAAACSSAADEMISAPFCASRAAASASSAATAIDWLPRPGADLLAKLAEREDDGLALFRLRGRAVGGALIIEATDFTCS